jgi:hypothetical protein
MESNGYGKFFDESGGSSAVHIQNNLDSHRNQELMGQSNVPAGRKPVRTRERELLKQRSSKNPIDLESSKISHEKSSKNQDDEEVQPDENFMNFQLNKSLYCFIVKVLAQKSNDNDKIFVLRSLVATILMFTAQVMIMFFIWIEVNSKEPEIISEEYKHFCRFIILFLLYCIVSLEMKQAIDLMVLSYMVKAKKFVVHGTAIGIMQYFISFFVMLTSGILITQSKEILDMVLNFSALIVITSMDDMIAEHIGMLVGETIEDDFYNLRILKSQHPSKYVHWKTLRTVLFFGPLLFLLIFFSLACANIYL